MTFLAALVTYMSPQVVFTFMMRLKSTFLIIEIQASAVRLI
jgi:hypothetical protein